MNIPLDNLYHWVISLVQQPVILYVFQPHGSKDIFDLVKFKGNAQDNSLTPMVVCHDQEPLDFSVYQFDYDLDRMIKLMKNRIIGEDTILINEMVEECIFFCSYLKSVKNLYPTWLNILELNDWTILLHSEMNSKDVDQFATVGFRPVYYWSHAVISRDWYRFAQYDARLKSRNAEKTFLVYCRDWTPNREYRLKFLDLVVQHNLTKNCCISTQHVNNQGVHLKDYKIQNYQFSIDTGAILSSVPDNNVPPSSSADYDTNDIISTRVSVILETVVDGDKIHLTEKTLRPIACAHPFVLAAGPGALGYLRSYGFKTFGDFWDESYDQEPDTLLRLEKIISAMKQIQHFTNDDWQKIQRIADYNQQHFFSNEFMAQVTAELEQNLNAAVDFCTENRGQHYWEWRKAIRRSGVIKQWPNNKSDFSRRSIRELRQHRLSRSRNDS